MAPLVVALLIAAPNANVELELGAGAAHSLESDSTSSSYPFAVLALQPRVAVDLWNTFSVGASFLGIIGGEAVNGAGGFTTATGHGAFTATATLLSVRVHSPGAPQVWAEFGGGIGHLISLQTDNSFEHAPLRGHAGFSMRLAGGARWPVGPTLLLGGELGLTRWSNVETGPTGPSGVPTSGRSTWALNLLFTTTCSLFDR
jgi:hypothetical protein